MEWKQAPVFRFIVAAFCLETFLSGMETGLEIVRKGRFIHLETFLSGMETRLATFLFRASIPLKPSLVEWKPRTFTMGIRTPSSLETFLSGMETSGLGAGVCLAPQALKPSLVEWKQITEWVAQNRELTLKPSLVEWKPRPNRSREVIVCP